MELSVLGWSFTETCRQLLDLRRRYPESHTILIEDAANGTAIIDQRPMEGREGKYFQEPCPLEPCNPIDLPGARL